MYHDLNRIMPNQYYVHHKRFNKKTIENVFKKKNVLSSKVSTLNGDDTHDIGNLKRNGEIGLEKYIISGFKDLPPGVTLRSLSKGSTTTQVEDEDFVEATVEETIATNAARAEYYGDDNEVDNYRNCRSRLTIWNSKYF